MARWATGWASAVLLGFLPLAPAQAAICADDTECDVHLTNTNVLGVTVDILVHINNLGATTVLTVSFVGDNITNTPLGIDQFGFNSIAGTTTLPPGWSNAGCPLPPGPPPPGCQMDGFGRFSSEIDNPGGTDLSFSFTLDSIVTNFTENTRGAEFAAHIRYSGNCSAFVSDGTSDDPGTNANCIVDDVRPVPEPGTLLLIGIALAGIGFARRTKTSR